MISVCMLTYNHAEFVAEAIRGVLMQEVDADVELIIGDDHSTDDTVSIIKELQQKFPQSILLIERLSNVGMMVNFTDVLRSCNGQYIAICEGDDYWIDPKKLSKQTAILDKEKRVDIVFTNSKVFNQARAQFSPSWATIEGELFDIEDVLASNFITTCTVLFRNKINNKLLDSLVKFTIGDWPLYLLLLNLSNSEVRYINDETAVYREHSGGSYSAISTEKRIKCVLSIYEELLRIDDFYKYRKVIYRKISSLFYFLGCKAVSTKDASNYYKRAIQLRSMDNIKYPVFSIVRYMQRNLVGY